MRLAPRLSLEYYSPPGCGELPRRAGVWERRQAWSRGETFFGEAAAGAASEEAQQNCTGGPSQSSGPEERDSAVRQLFRPSPESALGSPSPGWALPFLPGAHCRGPNLSATQSCNSILSAPGLHTRPSPELQGSQWITNRGSWRLLFPSELVQTNLVIGQPESGTGAWPRSLFLRI